MATVLAFTAAAALTGFTIFAVSAGFDLATIAALEEPLAVTGFASRLETLPSDFATGFAETGFGTVVGLIALEGATLTAFANG